MAIRGASRGRVGTEVIIASERTGETRILEPLEGEVVSEGLVIRRRVYRLTNYDVDVRRTKKRVDVSLDRRPPTASIVTGAPPRSMSSMAVTVAIQASLLLHQRYSPLAATQQLSGLSSI